MTITKGIRFGGMQTDFCVRAMFILLQQLLNILDSFKSVKLICKIVNTCQINGEKPLQIRDYTFIGMLWSV